MSAAPHIWTVIAGQIFGSVSDLLLTKNLVPKGILRKSMHTFGFLFPAAGIGLLGYILDDWKISVAIMTIGYGFRGATYSGHALVTIFFFYFLVNIRIWEFVKPLHEQLAVIKRLWPPTYSGHALRGKIFVSLNFFLGPT